MANRLILESTLQGALSVSESEATLEALVSLLRPVLCASDTVPDAHERLFRKTLRFIDEHICSEELCPEAIAREVGFLGGGCIAFLPRRAWLWRSTSRTVGWTSVPNRCGRPIASRNSQP